MRLRAVDARAQDLGIMPGQTLADARVHDPSLAVVTMDEAADQDFLKRLAKRCLVWSPLVALAAPDGITLDMTGVAHLFGGEVDLAAQIDASLSLIGLTVCWATAATAEGAQALARHSPPHHGRLPSTDERQDLHALPISALLLDTEATLALCRAGLTSIGDIATRPASSIAARFGMGAITALRRLLGEENTPIDPLTSCAPLHFERRFAEPVMLQASAAACFLDLLHEAARALETRGLGGRRFILTLFRSDGAQHRLAIETLLPTRDPASVLRLFDERVAALADPLDPGFGYDRITLFVPATEPLTASQTAFDGSEQDNAAMTELIDRLSTRLGPSRLYRLAPQDSHIPEQGQLALPAARTREATPWPAPPAGEPPLRPLFLFDPPQPVEVIAEVPDGPPQRFRWQRKLHDVRLYEGPERIAAEWWRREDGHTHGRGGLTRDYYRIEDLRGRRYWIFRHGLYDEKPDPRHGPKWYMHGLFA